MVPKHLRAPAAMQAEQRTMPRREKRDSHAAQGPGFSPNNWLEEGEKNCLQEYRGETSGQGY